MELQEKLHSAQFSKLHFLHLGASSAYTAASLLGTQLLFLKKAELSAAWVTRAVREQCAVPKRKKHFCIPCYCLGVDPFRDPCIWSPPREDKVVKN